ncbi:hypothetical protein PV326_012681 [Microctonus aethiopoides]|nr:hypothetical protein PV326_012681 [Microctonus aethiopoides]
MIAVEEDAEVDGVAEAAEVDEGVEVAEDAEVAIIWMINVRSELAFLSLLSSTQFSWAVFFVASSKAWPVRYLTVYQSR